MTLFDQFNATVGSQVSAHPRDLAAVDGLAGRIRGYSGAAHYAFFKALLTSEQIHDFLMLGVYHGRDISFITDILACYHPGRTMRIVGVDKFSDTPCADWPAGSAGKRWHEAGFGAPPSMAQALQALGSYVPVELVESEDASYLHTTDRKFDVVYLDTAHDYETVMRQLRQARRVCKPGAIICGDDYSDQGTWGVQRAVREAFKHHSVFADWIWVSSVDLLK